MARRQAVAQTEEMKLATDDAMRELRPLLKDGDFWRVVEADYNHVQVLMAHPSDAPKSEIESRKNYLRDQALWYAEESEPK